MNALADAIESTLKPVDFDGPVIGLLDSASLSKTLEAALTSDFDFPEVNPLPPLAATPLTKPR